MKNINFVMQKSRIQNNTVVQSMLFVKRIQYMIYDMIYIYIDKNKAEPVGVNSYIDASTPLYNDILSTNYPIYL